LSFASLSAFLSTDGTTDCAVEGDSLGFTLADGLNEGDADVDGSSLTDGLNEGDADVDGDSDVDGSALGVTDGFDDGTTDGTTDGAVEGDSLGFTLGTSAVAALKRAATDSKRRFNFIMVLYVDLDW
jgi:hypothetical protein